MNFCVDLLNFAIHLKDDDYDGGCDDDCRRPYETCGSFDPDGIKKRGAAGTKEETPSQINFPNSHFHHQLHLL